ANAITANKIKVNPSTAFMMSAPLDNFVLRDSYTWKRRSQQFTSRSGDRNRTCPQPASLLVHLEGCLYTIDAMRAFSRIGSAIAIVCLMLCLLPTERVFASAYNGRPRLIVIIIIDQFRGDYLERYREQFGEGGFLLFLDRGASFSECNYDYANTRTAPGHATLLTGAYSDGHGIAANEWWDPQKKRMVTAVEDDAT